MDDWKLKITPVVRLNRPNKRFFFIFFFWSAKNDFGRVLLSRSQLLNELESKAFCGEVKRSSRQRPRVVCGPATLVRRLISAIIML